VATKQLADGSCREPQSVGSNLVGEVWPALAELGGLPVSTTLGERY
jgi:hypothetical protein